MNENAQQLYDDLVNGRLEEFDMYIFTTMMNASRFLGITEKRARALCLPEESVFGCYTFPWGGHRNPYNATQQEAAEALRRACTED